MDKRINQRNENVIFYPGLVKRLIEKGMEALKEKDGQAAYQFFLSAEEHEPEHPQILFGKMLSLVELGRLEEAVEHTSRLLYEGIGDYFDNLQVHISLLVQLGKHEKVVELITAVLSEHRVPAHYAESFYQLLHFSRQMVENKGDLLQAEQPDPIDDIIDMLRSNSPEVQLRAIMHLKNSNHDEAVQALVTYIEKKDHDLVLQSVALQALQERNFKEYVHIEKQGREMDVRPSELEDFYQSPFGHDVVQQLEWNLEHENPFLLELAKQLCWAHLLALYPFLPEPESEQLWAAVFHYCAAERLGMEEELGKVSNHYQVDRATLHQEKKEVEKIEAMVFQADQFM